MSTHVSAAKAMAYLGQLLPNELIIWIATIDSLDFFHDLIDEN